MSKKPKMPKVIKQWVAALRSGKYKKGTGQLAVPVDKKYCCLGVLCELAIKAKVVNTYAAGEGGLPFPVQEWAGLRTSDPIIKGHELSVWNDGYEYKKVPRKSFKQIANLIEKRYTEILQSPENG
jgi:hypothetical protein